MKYKLLNEIGKGSFGTVYLSIDKISKKEFALKIINNDSKGNIELDIHNIFSNSQNANLFAPSIIETFTSNRHIYIVMELMHMNLEEIYILNNRSFNKPTIYKLFLDMINSLNLLHQLGFIHRDIKPQNFMIKLDENKCCKLVLIDYGLSKKYIIQGKHIEYKTELNFVGSLKFASLNAHKLIEQSRRDDMESICYVIIYLFLGSLPWKICTNDINSIKINKIGTLINNLDIDVSIKSYIRYVKSLKFSDEPNYDYLNKIIHNYCRYNKIVPNYEWNINNVA